MWNFKLCEGSFSALLGTPSIYIELSAVFVSFNCPVASLPGSWLVLLGSRRVTHAITHTHKWRSFYHTWLQHIAIALRTRGETWWKSGVLFRLFQNKIKLFHWLRSCLSVLTYSLPICWFLNCCFNLMNIITMQCSAAAVQCLWLTLNLAESIKQLNSNLALTVDSEARVIILWVYYKYPVT